MSQHLMLFEVSWDMGPASSPTVPLLGGTIRSCDVLWRKKVTPGHCQLSPIVLLHFFCRVGQNEWWCDFLKRGLYESSTVLGQILRAGPFSKERGCVTPCVPEFFYYLSRIRGDLGVFCPLDLTFGPLPFTLQLCGNWQKGTEYRTQLKNNTYRVGE